MIKFKTIFKHFFILLVVRELKSIIKIKHIQNVMHLIFEELANELQYKKSMKIDNFGTFSIIKNKDRKRFNVLEQKVTLMEGRNQVKFKIDPELKKNVNKLLDVKKTFGD